MTYTNQSGLGTKFKRGLFFTLCVLGIVAAPFISLAGNEPEVKTYKENTGIAKYNIVKTTSIVRLTSKNPATTVFAKNSSGS